MLTIIAAIGENNELGKKGGLCFRLPADLKLFKEATMGKKIFMGLNTFKSLPKRLEGREYYVLTHDKLSVPKWVHPVDHLEQFIREWMNCEEEMMVIGGGSVYQQCLPYCQYMLLTEIRANDNDADTFFPTISPEEWQAEKLLTCGVENGLEYKQVQYRRKHYLRD